MKGANVTSRGLSSQSSPDQAAKSESPKVDKIPDGGLDAWLVAIGSMIVMMQTWGLTNSFGVFQTFYENEFLPDHSSSDISWIGSLQGALLLMGTAVSGPLFDRGHFRALLIGGNAVVLSGLFMISFCTTFWQLLLAQGICIGIGNAMMQPPSAMVLTHWFDKRRPLALGLLSTGAPIATLVFPVAFHNLHPQIGFAWTVRVLAFAITAMSIVPVVFMKTRLPPVRTKGPFIDTELWTDVPFLVYMIAQFLIFLTLYLPFFYVQLYGLSAGISSSMSTYLISYLAAGSLVGRLCTNFLAGYIGSLHALVLALFMCGTIGLAWLAHFSSSGLIVWALSYGFASGGVVSISPSAIVLLCPNFSRLGARIGTAWFFTGVAVLVGTPIGGAILGNKRVCSTGDMEMWKGVVAYTGVALLCGAFLTMMTLLLHMRRNPVNKL